MANIISNLSPQLVWNYFYDITRIPRPSGGEDRILSYLKSFAKEHQLEYCQDKIGNLLILKKATAKMKNEPTLILQSHVDMVCEKNADVVIDFEKDPIELEIQEGYLKAKGTTLGADNGIGVAAQLAVLESSSIEHPALECLFTVSEEVGLKGVIGLSNSLLKGKRLINLDSEEEGDLYIGCAGGMDTIISLPYDILPTPSKLYFFHLKVGGLIGGHSGSDIHLKRANANKILATFLYEISEKTDLYISSIKGGSKRNAIAREAEVVAGVPHAFKECLRIQLNLFTVAMEDEYGDEETNIYLDMVTEDVPETIIDPRETTELIKKLVNCPHGVMAMSKDIPGLVETSTNLASIKMREDYTIEVVTTQRSLKNEEKERIAQQIVRCFKGSGITINHPTKYPAWQPLLTSPLMQLCQSVYSKMYNKKPAVKAIHAGLECALFLEKYPTMDMISFGPTLEAVHSPDERIDISTVVTFWDYLLEILKTKTNED